MTNTKFYSFKTNEGDKLINISNIASIECVNRETIITLNVKKNTETNISFTISDPHNSVAADIEILSNQI